MLLTSISLLLAGLLCFGLFRLAVDFFDKI
jgi:hypothetical protein